MMNWIFDGLQNLVANLGTSKDKSSGSFYTHRDLSRQELIDAYRGNWLPRKIVNIPARDSVKQWRDWSAEREEITKIEAIEKELQLKRKILKARTLARLTGGAAIMIGTGDNNLEQPLDPENIGIDGLKYLTVMTREELNPEEIDRDPASEFYKQPGMYTLTTASGDTGTRVHPSRLVRFFSSEPLDELIDGVTGWGDSCLQSVYSSLLQTDSTMAAVASMVFESKLDVVRVPGLMANIVNKGYEDKVVKRFGLAGRLKSINGMLLLDKEEEFDQKSLTFAGLPDVIDRFMTCVAGASDIPATRLWGRAPDGMDATGDSDTRNYYDAIRAEQELVMGPAMSVLDEVIIRSALGSRPEEIYYTWRPLWQPTAKEVAEVGQISAQTVKTLADSGVFPTKTLAEAAANTMIESGAMPGLDASVEENGLESEEPPDDGLALAAVGKQKAVANQQNAGSSASEVADAAPRTLYVRRDVVGGDAIERWARSQGLTNVVPASEMHVTIAYSKAMVDWMRVSASYEEEIVIAAGGPRVVEKFGDAVILLVRSASLEWRHTEFRDLGASWDYEDYQPHITLSYSGNDTIDVSKIQAFTGRIRLGPEIFEEIKT